MLPRLLIVPLFALFLAVPAASQDASPSPAAGTEERTLPRGEPAFGRTLGEWSAAWWHWSDDRAHTECAPSADDALWFLAAVHPDAPDRVGVCMTCSLPAGKAIFVGFPLTTAADAAQCEANLEEIVASVGGLRAFRFALDGEALPLTEDDRIEPAPLPTVATPTTASPVAFSSGVVCGYAFVLAPLSAGEHTLRVAVEAEGAVLVEVLNELTVR